MSRKKIETSNSVLDKIFNDLILILEDSFNEKESLMKTIKSIKNREISSNDEEIYRDVMTNIHSTGAYFIYMFAIFERNLRTMLKVMTRKKRTKNLFEAKWENFIDEKNLGAYHLKAKDYYKKPEFKYENYEVIARADTDVGRDPINFIETLIGIRSLSEEKGVAYLKYLTKYYWHKEIRNLIVHRGDEFDLTFIKTLKNTIKKTSLNPKTKNFSTEPIIRDFVLSHLDIKEIKNLKKQFKCKKLYDKNDNKKYIIKTNQLLDKLEGKKVKPNLLDLTKSLLFISAWLVYNDNQKVVNGFSPITSPLGNMTSLNHKVKQNLLCFHKELMQSLLISCHDSDINKIADSDKINILIELNLREERIIDGIRKGRYRIKGDKRKFIKQFKEEVKMDYEKYFHIKFLPSNMITVLDAFIKGNKKKYAEEILKTNFKEIAFHYKQDVDDVRQWLIFNKYN